MSISGESLQSIKNIKLCLTLLVIYIHILPEKYEYLSKDKTIGDNIYTYVSEIISHGIGHIAVPIFFVLSGFFLFFQSNQINIRFFKQKYISRTKSLLIPFILWNLTFAIVIYWKEYLFKYVGLSNYSSNIGFSPSKIIEYIIRPLDFPLWYIRDLILLVLFSPILYLWIKKAKLLGIVILYALYLSSIFFILSIWIPTTGLFYFSVGIYFAIGKNRKSLDFISLFRNTYKYYLILGLVILFILPITVPYTIIYQLLYRIMIPFLSIGFIVLISNLNLDLLSKKFEHSLFFILCNT